MPQNITLNQSRAQARSTKGKLTMSDLYSNDAIREHAEWLVRNEVYACASMMVSTIAQAGEDACGALGLDYYDDLMPLLESDETIPAPLDGLDVAELGDDGLAEFERAGGDVRPISPAYSDARTMPAPSLRIPDGDPRARIPARFSPGYLLQS